MRQVTALLALVALAMSPAAGAAQPAGNRPVAVADIAPADPGVGFMKYHYIRLDSSRSDPGDGLFPFRQWHFDWVPRIFWGDSVVQTTQIMKAGWQRVGLEVGSLFGPTDTTWKTIFVRDIPPWTDIPWAPRRYGGPRPTFVRGQLVVNDHPRIARVNASGIRVQVTCPRECIVDSALQITRYRARRIGLTGRDHTARINLAVASNTQAALEHRLHLRPNLAARRALRRRSRVPARVIVIVRALNGAKHTIRAQVELLGRRRR